jgi:hypothetical protein
VISPMPQALKKKQEGNWRIQGREMHSRGV